MEGLQCCLCHKMDHEGIILLNQYICRNCESEILEIKNNELKYESIKKGIKAIWKGISLSTS